MNTSGDSNSTGPINPDPWIHTYEAPFSIYAVNWSIRNDKSFRLAISGEYEDGERVQIVQLDPSGEIRPDLDLTVPLNSFPAIMVGFIPDRECQHADLFATGDEMLRLYKITNDQSGRRVDLMSQLNNEIRDLGAPLTSFDWNAEAMQRIVTSCVNNSCTVWDVERETVERFLTRHKDIVSDVSWGGPSVFASASYDGTVRISDVRVGGSSSQIQYTTPGSFGRVEWSTVDRNLMAVTIAGDNLVAVLDMRRQWMPVANLRPAAEAANDIAWAPNSSRHICTTGHDDMVASVWEIPPVGRQELAGVTPAHEHAAAGVIYMMKWSSLQAQWVALTHENNLEIVKIPCEF